MIRSGFLFLLMVSLPCVIIYLFFSDLAFYLIFASYLILAFLLYSYIDKYLLMILNAREVIDTDEQRLFQCIKNYSYRSNMVAPKVYLYSGSKRRCFILESRQDWSIVLDRELQKNMSTRQVEELVEYLFMLKATGRFWFQTKAMGIIAFSYKAITWLMRNLFFLNPRRPLYRTFKIFSLSLIRPVLLPFEYFGKQQKPLEYGGKDIEPIILRALGSDYSYAELVTVNLFEQRDGDVLIQYLDSYPVLENCRFINYEF